MAVHKHLFWKNYLANRLITTAFRLTRDDDGLLVKSRNGRVKRRMLTEEDQWESMDDYVQGIVRLLEPADPDIDAVRKAVDKMVAWYSRQPGNAAEDLAEITQGAIPTYSGYDHHGQRSMRANLASLSKKVREASQEGWTDEDISNALLKGLKQGTGTDYAEQMQEQIRRHTRTHGGAVLGSSTSEHVTHAAPVYRHDI